MENISIYSWEDNIEVMMKLGGRLWTAFMQLKIGTSMGDCEHSNEP
jgi:hypothetical protein